jgi:hypothetical protein
MDTQGQIVKKLWKGFGNNPLNQRTVDSMKGMLGLLPLGAGDVASGLLAADDVRRGDYVSAGLNGVGVLPYVPSMGAGLLGHTVWHGSPHKFDKFDMSKIGTGEGAQAYGHGLYFAESPEVAQGYAKTLSNVGTDRYASAHLNAQNQVQKFGNDPEWASEVISDLLRNTDDKLTVQKLTDTLDFIKSGKYKEPVDAGTTYKVDIPDEILPRMLDWDKPLSQQHPDVQPVLRDMWKKAKKSFDGIDLNADPAAAQVHHLYGQHRGGNSNSSVAIADELKQAGIPGIRYLDGNSRGTGGTSNFVLFDDQLPRILERNGVPTGQQPWKPEELKGLFGM